MLCPSFENAIKEEIGRYGDSNDWDDMKRVLGHDIWLTWHTGVEHPLRSNRKAINALCDKIEDSYADGSIMDGWTEKACNMFVSFMWNEAFVHAHDEGHHLPPDNVYRKHGNN